MKRRSSFRNDKENSQESYSQGLSNQKLHGMKLNKAQRPTMRPQAFLGISS